MGCQITPQLLDHRRTNPGYPLDMTLGGPQSQCGPVGEQRNLCFRPKSNHCRPPRRLVTFLTGLPWFTCRWRVGILWFVSVFIIFRLLLFKLFTLSLHFHDLPTRRKIVYFYFLISNILYWTFTSVSDASVAFFLFFFVAYQLCLSLTEAYVCVFVYSWFKGMFHS